MRTLVEALKNLRVSPAAHTRAAFPGFASQPRSAPFLAKCGQAWLLLQGHQRTSGYQKAQRDASSVFSSATTRALVEVVKWGRCRGAMEPPGIKPHKRRACITGFLPPTTIHTRHCIFWAGTWGWGALADAGLRTAGYMWTDSSPDSTDGPSSNSCFFPSFLLAFLLLWFACSFVCFLPPRDAVEERWVIAASPLLWRCSCFSLGSRQGAGVLFPL